MQNNYDETSVSIQSPGTVLYRKLSFVTLSGNSLLSYLLHKKNIITQPKQQFQIIEYKKTTKTTISHR